MMSDEELEISERKKYNYFVTEKSYGSDFRRGKQIRRMVEELGQVSVGFLNILSELKHKDTFKVLDIGSGPGGVMAWFDLEHGADVYGIDISDVFVEHAKNHFPYLENILVGNANNMHMFEDDTFDLVCHLDGMEHIPEVWERDCLKEAIRVSKKYVFYEIACSPSVADLWAKEKGLTEAHINIKHPDQWLSFYENHAKEFNYQITHKHQQLDANKAKIMQCRNQSVILKKVS